MVEVTFIYGFLNSAIPGLVAQGIALYRFVLLRVRGLVISEVITSVSA
jgi:hypothetical protein